MKSTLTRIYANKGGLESNVRIPVREKEEELVLSSSPCYSLLPYEVVLVVIVSGLSSRSLILLMK